MKGREVLLKKILILAPHTDDAEIGCGGFISKMLREEAEIYIAVFSSCEKSLPKDYPPDMLKNEFIQSMNFLQISPDNYCLYDYAVRTFPENRQSILDDLIKLRDSIQPTTVLCPSVHDYHQDHQVLAQEAIRCFKNVASIISYELPWNHITFEYQMFVRLTEYDIERKWNSLQHYKTQFAKNRQYFSKDFIYSLARVRGAQCNAEFAECFEIVRWIHE